MATVPTNLVPSLHGPGAVTYGGGFKGPMSILTLTGADIFRYLPEAKQFLLLRNPSAAALGTLTVTLLGRDNAPVGLEGYGFRDTTASGYSVIIAQGDSYIIPLDTIRGYLSGIVDVTGAPGLHAAIISYM